MLPPGSASQYDSPHADKSRSDQKFPSLDEIHKALLVHNSPAVINPVAPLLDDYFCRNNTRVTDFQSKLFKGTIEHPDTEWPVVEWNEPDLCSEIFSIFKVNTKIGLASYLIHSGIGGRQTDGRRYADSSFSWSVLGMDDLKELVLAGRQVLDMLNWSEIELSKQFFDPTQTDCSVQQYCFPSFPMTNL